jgi:tetratricopeptide (TPR) repeat protein
MPISPVYRCRLQVLTLTGAVLIASMASPCHAAGEPAPEFLKRLRAARLFDTAITYLDRLDQYPGVSPDLLSAIALEKAQTYIDAAVASRSSDARDEYFQQAENQLTDFLKQSSHARLSEARLQLGKLQMVRAAQLLFGKPDKSKRTLARESYLAAAKTFDTIVDALRTTLKEMQGARIDADKEPEKAALRDQYRGEFLQALSSAGESRLLAARTFDDPGKEGKELLDKALVAFTDLSEKYDTYVQGAIATLYRAQVQDDLGMKEQALDSYIRMLEQPDADPLRDAKYQATDGLIRMWLAETPARFQSSIDRGQPMIDGVRPNERSLSSVQSLRIKLGKAYLEKAKDKENQKPADLKRAESNGRQLLIKASKVPGEYADEANRLLVGLGIDLEATSEMPTAEDPTSLEDALEKARELVTATENLTQSLGVLKNQENPSDTIAKQTADIEKQLNETRSIAIQILRRGLSMVASGSEIELVNQARQSLAYLLYLEKNYRDSAVVGGFLATNAPATEVGLRGGLLALNSLQLLLVENASNTTLIGQLEDLGTYLVKTWPNNPDANAAQGVMIMLALRSERWNEARELIEKMPPGPERASFQRLMGQLLWNESIKAREAGDATGAGKFLEDAAKDLQAGLDEIPGNLVDPAAMKAALILAKVYLKRDEIKKSSDVLDHNKYGPVKLIAKQGTPDKAFASDLYSTELQVIVQRMTSDDGDSKKLLARAIDVMEKLRTSVAGPDAQKQLTGIYIRMAKSIREQLDNADPAKKAKLIDAFRVFLDRISTTTDDTATLQWVGQTLMDLAEVSMAPNEIKAKAQAAALLDTAVATFQRLKDKAKDAPLTVDFQLGRAQRLLGNYKAAIDILEKLLIKKPMMLDAQMEAALAYEQWAAILPPKFTGKAYESALNGARPDAQKKNVIWGWGKVSQMTSRDLKYREMFFNARYHVALCRFLWGKAVKSKPLTEKSTTDITKVNALYPKMGGPQQRAKFDQLLKLIQRELGQQPQGLPPLPAA